MYKKILVPTDGSKGSEKALEHAIDIAEKFDSEIHLLYVVDVRSSDTEELYANIVGKMREIGEEQTETLSEKVSSEGISVETEVAEGIPHSKIIRYTEEENIDLTVMGTHGRTGLNRLLIGSTAEKVVRNSDKPVMTVSINGDSS